MSRAALMASGLSKCLGPWWTRPETTLSGGCKTMRDFSPYFRSTVGFDHLFDALERAADAGNGYPPFNIERSDETHYRISVAVAGFAEKDLTVEVRDGVLTIQGKREDADKGSYL